MNRSGEIVKINAAANINNLEINGNIENGNWGMIWDGSSAMDKSLFTNSEIKSNNCNCEVCSQMRVCLCNYNSFEPTDQLAQRFRDSIEHTCSEHKIYI